MPVEGCKLKKAAQCVLKRNEYLNAEKYIQGYGVPLIVHKFTLKVKLLKQADQKLHHGTNPPTTHFIIDLPVSIDVNGHGCNSRNKVVRTLRTD